MSERQHQCRNCETNDNTLKCNGCEQTFCQTHSTEHRQELKTKLNTIVQLKDLIAEELNRPINENILMNRISYWEHQSIQEIQQAAEAARADLRNIIERSNHEISMQINDISVNLQSACDTEKFSEIDLRQWSQKLQELKLELDRSSKIKLTETNESVIRLIRIHERTQHTDSPLENFPQPIFPDRFSKVLGSANISEEGLLVNGTETNVNYSNVLCQNLYSQGRQTIKFKIERRLTPDGIFFGCISFRTTEDDIKCLSSFAAGWFGLKVANQNGVKIDVINKENGQRNEVLSRDILHLTLDCDQKQIELFHERTNQQLTLPIDVSKAPLPWRILLGLAFKGDSLRILP